MKYERKKQYTATGVFYVCHKCKQTKDLCEFPIDKRSTKGHSTRCRTCAREHMRRSREEGGIPVNTTNETKRKLIRTAKDKPCADCGKRYPYFVMDLDHLPEFNKSFTISKSNNYSIDQIKEELKKCETVCSNCHRFRTAQRLGMV